MLRETQGGRCCWTSCRPTPVRLCSRPCSSGKVAASTGWDHPPFTDVSGEKLYHTKRNNTIYWLRDMGQSRNEFLFSAFPRTLHEELCLLNAVMTSKPSQGRTSLLQYVVKNPENTGVTFRRYNPREGQRSWWLPQHNHCLQDHAQAAAGLGCPEDDAPG